MHGMSSATSFIKDPLEDQRAAGERVCEKRKTMSEGENDRSSNNNNGWRGPSIGGMFSFIWRGGALSTCQGRLCRIHFFAQGLGDSHASARSGNLSLLEAASRARGTSKVDSLLSRNTPRRQRDCLGSTCLKWRFPPSGATDASRRSCDWVTWAPPTTFRAFETASVFPHRVVFTPLPHPWRFSVLFPLGVSLTLPFIEL